MGCEQKADLRDDAGFQHEPPMAGGAPFQHRKLSHYSERGVLEAQEIMVVLVLFSSLRVIWDIQKSCKEQNETKEDD